MTHHLCTTHKQQAGRTRNPIVPKHALLETKPVKSVVKVAANARAVICMVAIVATAAMRVHAMSLLLLSKANRQWLLRQ